MKNWQVNYMFLNIPNYLTKTHSNKWFFVLHFFDLEQKTCKFIMIDCRWKNHASRTPTLRFSQIWDFSENLSCSYQTVPPNTFFLNSDLSSSFFSILRFFIKCVCHQQFFSLTWGTRAIFQKMLRLANSNLR